MIRLDDAAAERICGGVRAVSRCRLRQDVGDVFCDRVDADGECHRDLFIGLSTCDETKDFDFASR